MFSLDLVKKQVIALMNLAPRNTAGVATYGTTTGDKTYADDELTRACRDATTEIMRAICETSGHAHRPLFVSKEKLAHGKSIPEHIGEIGIPRITPYVNATYQITGKRKSVEDISAYRSNPGQQYSKVAHDAANGDYPSKLAGFYAIDEATNTLYFTGYAAEADLANCTERDSNQLPDIYYPSAIAIAISRLVKDGATSDLFSYYGQIGNDSLSSIRAGRVPQPSMEPTIGARDSGAK